MRHITFYALFFTFALFAGSIHAAELEKIDLKAGKWSNLAAYIGTYEYDAVLGDKNVKAALGKILKDKNINLKDELQVSAPIGFEDDCLILKGNPPMTGDIRRAYLEVCINKAAVNLAVMNKKTVAIYTQYSRYQFLSEGMREWIYFLDKQTDLEKKPDNVQLIIQAE